MSSLLRIGDCVLFLFNSPLSVEASHRKITYCIFLHGLILILSLSPSFYMHPSYIRSVPVSIPISRFFVLFLPRYPPSLSPIAVSFDRNGPLKFRDSVTHSHRNLAVTTALCIRTAANREDDVVTSTYPRRPPSRSPLRNDIAYIPL